MSKGAAILAVGHGLSDATATLTSLVAQIGETLLANDGWRVRRLSPLVGERDGADRASWKRCVSELCDGKVDTIVLALAGVVTLHGANESAPLASTPPLVGPWDARRTSRPDVPRPTEQEEVLGTVLPGRFKIEHELARGSFGNVYRARQLAVDRDVAVMVLHGGVAPGSETGRLFVQEIQSVGRLDHPNVVRIYQADITAAGSLFYAMELLAGRDHQQIIETDGVLETTRAGALARQLASALGAAHDVGLVHADVKPANALVVAGKDGGERLVLLAFGLARLRSETTSAGGTPAYMAPAQLRDARVAPRSDVFSAALVLVPLLTGWRRKAADQLVPPLDGDADPKQRAELAKALSVAPADRYQSGGELAAVTRDVHALDAEHG